jgi:exonuclease SbcC
LPDLAELSKVQNWYTIRKSLFVTKLENTKELEIIQSEIKILIDRFINSIENIELGSDRNLAIEVVLELLTQKVTEARNLITGIEKNIEHLLIRAKLEEYATDLSDGKPCPLCGSLTHPDILDGGNVKMLLQIEREKKSMQDKAIAQKEKVMVNLREIRTQLRVKQEAQQKLKDKQIENQTQIDAHQSLFEWKEFESESLLIQSFKDAESMMLLIKTLESKLRELRNESETQVNSLEMYKTQLDKITQLQTSNFSEINTLSRQIENLDIQEFILKSAVEVKQMSDRNLIKYSEIESVFEKTNSEIALVQKRNDESSGKLLANQAILSQQQKSQEAIKSQIDRQFALSPYSSAAEIKEILNKKIDTEVEKLKIQTFRQQMQISENQLYLLKNEISDRIYIPEYHQKLTQEVSNLNDVQSEKNRELGKTESQIRKLSDDLKEQKQLRMDLDKLEMRGEDIKTMKQLFKGSGFVNYVSSVHLRNLCLAANDRFYKLVRQKMSLEITEDNSFQVRDYLNGGKVRSVKTLSGGQTFQAALSLALSLADSIQQFTDSSQNFFFLDEGFGSLDKESLDVVFETLKSLRKENRIVGVISHVEEMQQEIDTHLRIVNDEENGSTVYRSWEN